MQSMDRIEKDNVKNDYDLVSGKGRSMAYFSTPEEADERRKSTTCMHRKKHGCTRDIINEENKSRQNQTHESEQN